MGTMGPMGPMDESFWEDWEDWEKWKSDISQNSQSSQNSQIPKTVMLNDTPKCRSRLSKMVLLQCRTGIGTSLAELHRNVLCSTGLQCLRNWTAARFVLPAQISGMFAKLKTVVLKSTLKSPDKVLLHGLDGVKLRYAKNWKRQYYEMGEI